MSASPQRLCRGAFATRDGTQMYVVSDTMLFRADEAGLMRAKRPRPSQLDPEQKRMLRAKYTEGGVSQLASEFGVSQQLVSLVLSKPAA